MGGALAELLHSPLGSKRTARAGEKTQEKAQEDL
jgi:hypothetical protein